MSTVAELVEKVMSRSAIPASFAGDVLPSEAYDALRADASAILVDVRSEPEWAFSGTPDLASLGKRPMLLSWRLYPDFSHNPQFITDLTTQLAEAETPVFFLCKTGGRSREAAIALTAQGYRYCFNIAGGFEGDANAQGQRGKVNGWKAEGLPWRQA